MGEWLHYYLTRLVIFTFAAGMLLLEPCQRVLFLLREDYFTTTLLRNLLYRVVFTAAVPLPSKAVMGYTGGGLLPCSGLEHGD